LSDFYNTQITLIDKNAIGITPIPINGDNSFGNLTKYRVFGRYSDTINDVTKNGTLVLRCPDGLFESKNPILSDENTKSQYLIEVKLSQQENAGQTFRFEISKCTVEKGEKGYHASLELTGYDIRLEEFVDSENLILQNPKEALKQRIQNFTTGRDLTSTGSIKLTFNDVNNLLPQSPRQNYTPTKPISTKKLLMDIISRASRPETAGSTNEDWYYSITPQRDTESFRIFVDKMGAVDSGVILSDSDHTVLKKVSGDIDNTKWKNIIIARGVRGSHSLPMNFCKKSSEILHDGTISDSPDASPLTNDVGIWQDMIPSGKNPPTGYAGFFNDFNIVNSAYERSRDEYADVSLKDVIDFISTPPDSPLHGQRWLVNNGTGTIWQGHNNAIAQWNAFEGIWHFSNNPKIDDTVYLRSNSTMLRFDGVTWQTDWNLSSNPGKATAFHPVEQISLVRNRSGIRKAIKFKFNWNAFDGANLVQDIADILGRTLEIYANTNGVTKFLTGVIDSWSGGTASEFLSKLGKTDTEVKNAIGIGHQNNLASRWAGFSVLLPFASFDSSYLDFYNMDKSQITKKKGWNSGKDSEDLGEFRSVIFWCRMSYLTHDNFAVNGKSEIPMIFWFRDIFDRIVYKEFQIRAHDVWQKINLSVNDDSWKLYDQRIDELWNNIFGYTLPFDHFIRQRELTGVQFDWRFVKEMGCFTKESYNKQFFYIGAQDSYFTAFQEHLAQAGSYLTSVLPEIDLEKTIIDHVDFAIDDLHFGKDAYVTTSNDTEIEPRIKVIEISKQYDYTTLQHLAQRYLSREQYHPQNHIIDCRGDVRIKAGHKLLLKSGSGDIELVPTRVDHINDSTGYHCVVHGVRRFTV